MATAEEFDEFYLSSRRDLLGETFLVGGDLRAAEVAVNDAFTAAGHHWRKVGRADDPEAWVRSRAWRHLHGRRAGRARSPDAAISETDAATLVALQRLPEAQRRLVVLVVVSSATEEQIRRELAVPTERAEQLLAAATASLTTELDCTESELHDRFVALAEVADNIRLPRPPAIRRRGTSRRRRHAVIGSVAAVALSLGAGAVALDRTPTAPEPDLARPVTKRMLLTSEAIAPLAASGAASDWQLVETSDNTDGTGIHTMCQATRFADDAGVGALVRTFATDGPRQRRLVQAVEASASPQEAEQAYATTVGWYADCTVVPIRLVDTYRITGVGDEAVLMRMLLPRSTPTSYAVAIARSGSLTISVVLSLPRQEVPNVDTATAALADAVTRLCESPAAGTCVGEPATTLSGSPPAATAPGSLAVVDLPVIPDVAQPWVGTEPESAREKNPAATTCDRASFDQPAVSDVFSRTYVIPRSSLPPQFGLSQTVATFKTPTAAQRFVDRAAERMRTCADRDLGSTISKAEQGSNLQASYQMWRLRNQINIKEDEVSYWTGFVRLGTRVSQVTFTPVGRYDIDRTAFRDLLTRVRHRLEELPPDAESVP